VNDDDEKRMQEYLDGRLSESERSEFELRLEADAELQRAARAALELRKLLQEDAAELPPGFYARARERFERTVPARGRRWFRLLSWESAGLAAAVVLVAVLFVPPMMQDRSFRDDVFAPTRRMSAPSPKQTAAAEPVPSVGRPEPQDKPDAEPEQQWDSNLAPAPAESAGQERRLEAGDDAKELGMSEAVAEKAESRDGRGARRAAADDDGPRDARNAVAEPPPPAPSEAEREAGPAVDALEPSLELQKQVVPSASVPQDKKRGAPESFARDKEYERARGAAERDEATGVGGADVAGAKAPAAPEGSSMFRAGEYSPDPSALEPGVARILEARELPPGAVPPGAVKIVDTEEEWNEVVARSANRALESVRFETGRRIVLIGPRSVPVACSPITARVTGDRTEILLPHPGIEGRTAASGCVVYLPRSSPAGVVVRDPS